MKKILFSLLFCLFSIFAIAQKTYIGYVFPSGGCRGTEFVIKIGGQSILGCKDVIISGEGIKTEVIPIDPKEIAKQKQARKQKSKNITDEDNMQLSDVVQVKVTIDKNAELGIRDIKVIAPNGTLSNRLFFEISEYPTFTETEPNNNIKEPNRVLELPSVVSGQVEKGGRDFFVFTAKKGQTIVAQTKARRFVPFLADAVPGWFQAVTTLYDSDFNEVAYSDDYNLIADPTIIYKVEKSGDYYLDIKDAIFRGRSDFVYRISLGEIPFVSSVFPLGWKQNSNVELEVKGVNLTKETIKFKTPEPQERYDLRVTNKKKYNSNPMTLQISDFDEVLIKEDVGDTYKTATPIVENTVYNARIEHEYDSDWYSIDITEKGPWIFEITSRRLGAALDAQITIFGAGGKAVVKQEDDTDEPTEGMITHHADPQLLHAFKATGKFLVRITDAQNKFGDNYGYRLRAFRAEPDFSLSIEPSAISIPQGGTAQITIFPTRKYGFKAPLAIKSDDMPEGFSLTGEPMSAAAKSIKMAITASPDAPLGKVDFSLYGESKSKSGEIIKRAAQPVEAMLQAFYITHLIPTDEFRIDIKEPDPFTFSIDENQFPLQLSATEKTPLKVKINRKDGYAEPILVMFRFPLKGIAATPVTATATDEYVTLMIECTAWKLLNKSFSASLLGTVKASTKAQVAGQKKNSISANVMVVSPYFSVLSPGVYPEGYTPPVKKPAQKNMSNK